MSAMLMSWQLLNACVHFTTCTGCSISEGGGGACFGGVQGPLAGDVGTPTVTTYIIAPKTPPFMDCTKN